MVSDSEGSSTLSFAVGDRVVMHGLQSATHLNGRHGCIVRDMEQGRYGVDIDVDMQRRAIKPTNLRHEQVESLDLEADVVQGILPEHPHGRAASYLLDLMRVNAAYRFSDYGEITQYDLARYRSSPMGMVKIAHLTALGWSNWTTEDDDGLDVGAGDVQMGVYELLKESVNEVLQNLSKQGTDDDQVQLPPEVAFAKEALQSPHAAGGWHVRVHGNFWIVGTNPETGATYLVPEENRSMVYEVLGIRNALHPQVARTFHRPVLMKATLIPWYGRLLYDGVVAPAHNQRLPQQASHSLTEKLHAAVEAAVETGRVISRLRDDTQSISAEPSRASSRVQPNRDPPNQEEQELLNQFVALPAPVQFTMDSFDVAKPWAWTFRRMGYTQEENPENMGMVIRASGDLLGPFSCSALAPTSVDILQSAVTYARQLHRQPAILSIDERVCCDRVKFLLRETGIRVEYYRPPSREETEAAMLMGNM